MNIRPLLVGLVTYVPGLYARLAGGTGGTISARYCYSVWLRHLVMAHKNGLPSRPSVVAELGPGDSIGVGLAALLSGAERYYALDIVEYASNRNNVAIFDELVELFRKGEAVPGESEFPEVKPKLASYEFPREVLDDKRMKTALDEARVAAIRGSLTASGGPAGPLAYFAPWYDPAVVRDGIIDMVYSQAVMEHVDDLRTAYGMIHRWLKPGGVMSHQIDFRCHGTAQEWNGHWAYSDLMWKIVKGKRPYLLNRQPHSAHIRIIEECGFEIVCDNPVKDPSGIGRDRLAQAFGTLSDADLTTSGAFIQAIRK